MLKIMLAASGKRTVTWKVTNQRNPGAVCVITTRDGTFKLSVWETPVGPMAAVVRPGVTTKQDESKGAHVLHFYGAVATDRKENDARKV